MLATIGQPLLSCFAGFREGLWIRDALFLLRYCALCVLEIARAF